MSESINETDAAELLAAGAVLPPGTEGAGERAVPLTARTYRHPGLDEDRVVVRLVAAELGAAEDLAAGFLGLERVGEPEVVGLGLRASLGFPEWVLVHHPEDGHHALAVVPELERTARRAESKPKATLDAYQELAAQLAAAVPHFLPTFYEQAGRVFLAAENPGYAAQMFTRARRAEVEYGLPVDEERLDAVFLEFALAGALPVKVLSGYAKELAARVPADEALHRYARLCVRRTAGGLPPSAQMTNDLRRLAKGAGEDAGAVEQRHVAELLALPATVRAAAGWWKAHSAAIVALATQRPDVRAALLDMMPAGVDHDLPGLWLEILEASGATDALCAAAPVITSGEPGEPGEPRTGAGAQPAAQGEPGPQDGAAGWLRRFLTCWESGWRRAPRLPGLLALVERMAGRLRTELAGRGAVLPLPEDIDLLDLLLSLDIPVADPHENHWLRLEQWAEGEGQRDLVALAADPRFRRAFQRSADGFSDDEDGRRALALLTSSPGGRPMLTEWVREVARRSTAAGLPELPEALSRLGWLPGEVLALAGDEMRTAAATDLAEVLARSLRAGILDELAWPAWEEAAGALVSDKQVADLVVADAWPYLIVAGPAQARVIGPEGTVLTHDLRIPAGDLRGGLGFHYVDGELLVFWASRQLDGRRRGYWHTAAGRPQPLEGQGSEAARMYWYSGGDRTTLPLPGGGRTTGAGVLHTGDTTLPGGRRVLTDGTSYWIWDSTDSDDTGWHEYDPVGGRRGRKGMPAFFADATRDKPAGSAFIDGRLLPVAATATATPAGIPVNGLLGWRAVRLPDGSMRCEDLSGIGVTVRGDGRPSGLLIPPGGDRPQAVVYSGYQVRLVDSDGVVTSVAKSDTAPGAFAAGTPILPPVSFWHCLRPRDPEGSAALRRIDQATAAAMLKAAASGGDSGLPGAVRALLPGVRHEALLTGIVAVLRQAAAQQKLLDSAAERLERALSGSLDQDGPAGSAGPTDALLSTALSGLGGRTSYWWYGSDEGTTTFQVLRAVTRAIEATEATTGAAAGPGGGEPPAGAAEAGPAAPQAGPAAMPLSHLDGAALPSSMLNVAALLDSCAAVALRAASGFTEPEHGAALGELLRAFDGLGATAAGPEPARWRRFRLRLGEEALTLPDGTERSDDLCGLLPLDGGGLLAAVEQHSVETGMEFTVLHHDPAGRFEVPAPYTVLSSAPVGEQRDPGWLAAFLAAWAEHGPAPWFSEAAGEFARLTGATETTARLVVAGLPQVDAYERNFLPPAVRTALGVKAADAAVARDELRGLSEDVRRSVVGALLPADPARLWSHGPDAAAAAEVWNAAVGKRIPVPEALVLEATKAVKIGWDAAKCIQAMLDPAAEPQLSRDLVWTVRGDRVAPEDRNATGFTATTLRVTVAMAAWLAHRLPAGDPIRAALPGALSAVRERLASPELMLDLDRYIDLPDFRKVAGAPTETGDGFERYGAVVMATHDDQPAPAIRTALLDSSGADAYLPALRGGTGEPFPAEVALRVAHDARFAALLADPGDPIAGERAKDGTWWPQDPGRSVPDLVTEAAERCGLGEDAAALYLMLLAMPDPTDRNTARWTGWKPARLKAVRAELAATELVIEAKRARAGRSLFLPGGWTDLKSPRLPLEQWKLPLFELIGEGGTSAPLGVVVPVEPAADVFRRAWQRIQEDDAPGFAELKVRRSGRGRR